MNRFAALENAKVNHDSWRPLCQNLQLVKALEYAKKRRLVPASTLQEIRHQSPPGQTKQLPWCTILFKHTAKKGI